MCALTQSPAAGAEGEALRRLLLAALPLTSPESVRLVEALARSGGLVHDAQRFALDIHMGSRYRVARVLRRERLPQLEELGAWVRVLRWLIVWQSRSDSLSRMALDDGLETSVCCRTVRRLTGATWTEARERGPEWAMILLIERCRALSLRSTGEGGLVEQTG
jgi:hypothetical protein